MAYTISELVERSGVPKFTIRHWIREGLLPRPDRAGRGALYSDEHLDRIVRIQRLQAQRYTNEEIRELLVSLDTTSEGETAREGALFLTLMQDADLAPSLRRVSRRYGPASDVPGSEIVRMLRQPPSERQMSQQGSEMWQRITITPDIELHVRGRDRRKAAQIQRLVRQVLKESREFFDREGDEE
jgi:DNA-binding transcriptional MerR regulator